MTAAPLAGGRAPAASLAGLSAASVSPTELIQPRVGGGGSPHSRPCGLPAVPWTRPSSADTSLAAVAELGGPCGRARAVRPGAPCAIPPLPLTRNGRPDERPPPSAVAGGISPAGGVPRPRPARGPTPGETSGAPVHPSLPVRSPLGFGHRTRSPGRWTLPGPWPSEPWMTRDHGPSRPVPALRLSSLTEFHPRL